MGYNGISSLGPQGSFAMGYNGISSLGPQGSFGIPASAVETTKIGTALIRRFEAGEITRSDTANVKPDVDSVLKHLALPTDVEQMVRVRFKQSGVKLTKSYVAQVLLEESIRFNNVAEIENSKRKTVTTSDKPVVQDDAQPSHSTKEQRVPTLARKPIKVVSTFGLHV